MEEAIKASLQAIDAARAEVEKERKQLERKMDAAEKARKKIEKEGDKLAEEYFQKARAAVVEFTRKEQLRDLTWMHLQKGRAVEDICHWLGVEREFVEGLIELMDRRADFRREQAQKNRIQLPGDPRLLYKDQGRSGTITYENGTTRFDTWWEFGTGRALLIIDVPNPDRWHARTGLPLEERDSVLRWIAEQVIADQTSGTHGFEIGESVITIFR